MNRWTVLVVTPGGAWPVELSSPRPAVLGRGRGVAIDPKDDRLAERHLSLAVREDSVQLEVLDGGGDVLVNDIPVSARATLRSGDEIRAAGVQLLLSDVPTRPPAPPRLAPFDEAMSRLATEVSRGGPRHPVGLVGVAPPSLNVAARAALTRRVVEEVRRLGYVVVWGELAADVLCGLVLDAEPDRLEALFSLLPRLAGPRARVATASSLETGLDADALVGAVWTGLLGPSDGAAAGRHGVAGAD